MFRGIHVQFTAAARRKGDANCGIGGFGGDVQGQSRITRKCSQVRYYHNIIRSAVAWSLLLSFGAYLWKKASPFSTFEISKK